MIARRTSGSRLTSPRWNITRSPCSAASRPARTSLSTIADLRALVGKPLDDPAPDAAAAAGDDEHLAFETLGKRAPGDRAAAVPGGGASALPLLAEPAPTSLVARQSAAALPQPRR